MSNTDPIYINQFSTGNSNSDLKEYVHSNIGETQFWKSAWHGHIPLWKAFWVYFVLGHGAVLGIGCGFLLFSLLAGSFFSGVSITLIPIALSIGGTIVSIIYFGFASWAVVSVWRSSRNCYHKRRGIYAKIAMMGYVTAVISPILWYLAG